MEAAHPDDQLHFIHCEAVLLILSHETPEIQDLPLSGGEQGLLRNHIFTEIHLHQTLEQKQT